MTPVRKEALRLLEGIKGAFLRCDRGDALYVTNAPQRTDVKIDWEAAGFHVREERGLAFLTPDDRWISCLYDWAAGQGEMSSAAEHIARASSGIVEEEDRLLMMECIKRLEMKGEAEECDRMVRQRAAVCLRKKQGGGTLPVCALLVDMMRGGWKDED